MFSCSGREGLLKERNICGSGCRINAAVSEHEGLGEVLQKDQGIARQESCSQVHRWFTVRMAMRKPGVAEKRTKAEQSSWEGC